MNALPRQKLDVLQQVVGAPKGEMDPELAFDLVSLRLNPAAVDFQGFRRAIANRLDEGLLPGIANVFAMWMISRGGSRGAREGIELLQALVLRGHLEACHNLAAQKIQGTHTDRDYRGAHELLRRVIDWEQADKGLRGSSHALLGESFRHGWGVPVHLPIALMHYQLAADFGDAEAALEAGHYYNPQDDAGTWCAEAPDYSRAAHYYRLAAEGGCVRGQTCLAALVLGGLVPGWESSTGLALLRRSAAEGDQLAGSLVRLGQRMEALRGAANDPAAPELIEGSAA